MSEKQGGNISGLNVKPNIGKLVGEIFQNIENELNRLREEVDNNKKIIQEITEKYNVHRHYYKGFTGEKQTFTPTEGDKIV